MVYSFLQIYLKLQCSCLLFGSEFGKQVWNSPELKTSMQNLLSCSLHAWLPFCTQTTWPKAVERDLSVSAHQSANVEESGSDVEDDLWASMETVEEKAGKRGENACGVCALSLSFLLCLAYLSSCYSEKKTKNWTKATDKEKEKQKINK